MKKSILFIAHSASRSGAPIVLLDLIRQLRLMKPEWQLDVLMLEGGSLESDFEKAAYRLFTPFRRVSKSLIRKGFDFFRFKILGVDLENEFVINYYKEVFDRQYDLCFFNSIEALQFLSIPVVQPYLENTQSILYLHESVSLYQKLNSPCLHMLSKMQRVVAISQRVKNQLNGFMDIHAQKADVIYSASVSEKQNLVFEAHNAESKKLEIYGSGVIHHRKGFDWFLQLALQVKNRYPDLPVAWTWIGFVDPLLRHLTEEDAEALGLDFTFTGEVNQPLEEYTQRDLLVITSREEPLSLAGIESAMLGKPVMYFKDRTGFEELDENASELAFPYGDLAAMAAKIKELAENRDKLNALGERNRLKFRNYTVEKMAESFIPIIENA